MNFTTYIMPKRDCMLIYNRADLRGICGWGLGRAIK